MDRQPLPPLIIWSRAQAISLDPVADEPRYTATATFSVSERSRSGMHVVPSNTQVYLAISFYDTSRQGWQLTIEALTLQLEPLHARPVHSLGSMAPYQGYLLAGAEGALMTLDQKLEEVSRISLPFALNPRRHRDRRDKNIHDILIYQNRLYGLDNIFTPMCVVDLDVTQPAQPELNRVIGMGGINSHLAFQWLDLRQQRWYIVESFGRMDGEGQDVVVLSMTEGNDKLDAFPLFYTPDTGFGSEMVPPQVGVKILAVTSLPPLLAFVREVATGQYSLSRIVTRAKGLRFERLARFPYLLDRPEAAFEYPFFFLMNAASLSIYDLRVSAQQAVAEVDLRLYDMALQSGPEPIEGVRLLPSA